MERVRGFVGVYSNGHYHAVATDDPEEAIAVLIEPGTNTALEKMLYIEGQAPGWANPPWKVLKTVYGRDGLNFDNIR